jgi:hypothetical protein
VPTRAPRVRARRVVGPRRGRRPSVRSRGLRGSVTPPPLPRHPPPPPPPPRTLLASNHVSRSAICGSAAHPPPGVGRSPLGVLEHRWPPVLPAALALSSHRREMSYASHGWGGTCRRLPHRRIGGVLAVRSASPSRPVGRRRRTAGQLIGSAPACPRLLVPGPAVPPPAHPAAAVAPSTSAPHRPRCQRSYPTASARTYRVAPGLPCRPCVYAQARQYGARSAWRRGNVRLRWERSRPAAGRLRIIGPRPARRAGLIARPDPSSVARRPCAVQAPLIVEQRPPARPVLGTPASVGRRPPPRSRSWTGLAGSDRERRTSLVDPSGCRAAAPDTP